MKSNFLNGVRLGGLATAKLLVSQGHQVWGARRMWFFDEAGWLETPTAIVESTVTGMTTPRCTRAELLS